MATKQAKQKQPKKPSYRFQEGAKVLCRTGDPSEPGGGWSAGEIVALTYREPEWPDGKFVPYQVQLEDGRLIFVPLDRDELCRKLKEPWWGAVFDKPGSHFAKNPPADVLTKAGRDEDVNEQNHRGYTALMQAVMRRWPNGISQLLQMKADPDIVGHDMTSALHIAVTHGIGIVKLLVDAKADLNCQDTDPDYDPEFTSTTFELRLQHRTPLHYACAEGDMACAKVLIEAGANIDIQDAQWKTPLHVAIDESQTDIIDLLLRSGANVNIGNKSSGFDNSTLMDAALVGNKGLVEKLIAAKADIHKQGKQQMSALHLAARSRHVQVAEILLAARADMNQESKCGTALQLARKNGGEELLKVFGVQPETSTSGSGGYTALDAIQRAALFLD